MLYTYHVPVYRDSMSIFTDTHLHKTTCVDRHKHENKYYRYGHIHIYRYRYKYTHSANIYISCT